MKGNSIGAKGCKALSEALKCNSTLTVLGFGRSDDGDSDK